MLMSHYSPIRVVAWAMVAVFSAVGWASPSPSVIRADEPLKIGSQRELFVDTYLIEKLDKCRLQSHRPHDEGIVLHFDKPWEGKFCGYCTVIREGDLFRVYYRGHPETGPDGDEKEVTCYAESPDGIHWTKPDLGIYEVRGTKQNNVVLANSAPASHNFAPFRDTRSDVPASQRYKALGGTMTSGLIAFVSADGKHWSKLRPEPVLAKSAIPFQYMFDSQNVALWSEHEKQYVCYFRVFQDKVRRICRTTSDDFVNWSPAVLMEYRHLGGESPIEHLYTNQTHPYFRAPHIYVSTAARFMPGRQVLSDTQAKEIGVDPGYFKDTSDAIFMTTRGDRFYDRTFLGSFIRGGIGAQNWVSRTNYPAWNVIQTSPTEMSVYVNQDYAQPTAHLRRYSLRLDGFASVQADYDGGEFVTKPFQFQGKELSINFSTSAAGGIRFELQNADGTLVPGFSIKDCQEQIGNEIDRIVSWKNSSDLTPLAGKPVRLRVVMKDADLFAIQFRQ